MSEANQIIEHEHQRSSGQVVAANPQQMLMTAIEKGLDAETIGRMMDLQERWEANEARKAFVAAMGAFKANPPRLTKNKQVSYTGTSYTHASLDHVCDVIGQGLAEHGLSYRWEVEQPEGAIRVTCILQHVLGHSERVSMTAPPDDSGKKNRIQQIASTTSYLERYSLLAITGMAAGDQDDDGAQSEAEPINTITEDQALDITAACEEIGLPVSKLLDVVSRNLGWTVTRVADIPAGTLKATLDYLDKKRGAK